MNKFNKSSSTSTNKRNISKIIGIGIIDLTLSLDLSENEFIQYQIDESKLESINDMLFLSEKQELWDRMSISSNNSLISTLLFINKISKQKTFVEFASLTCLKFSENEIFMKNIITHVTEHNFLFVNENELLPSSLNRLNFVLKKSTKEVHNFVLCSSNNVDNTNNTNSNADFQRRKKRIQPIRYSYMRLLPV